MWTAAPLRAASPASLCAPVRGSQRFVDHHSPGLLKLGGFGHGLPRSWTRPPELASLCALGPAEPCLSSLSMCCSLWLQPSMQQEKRCLLPKPKTPSLWSSSSSASRLWRFSNPPSQHSRVQRAQTESECELRESAEEERETLGHSGHVDPAPRSLCTHCVEQHHNQACLCQLRLVTNTADAGGLKHRCQLSPSSGRGHPQSSEKGQHMGRAFPAMSQDSYFEC